MSETLASLEKKREQLYKQLQESGDFRRGTISVVFSKCGKKNCACAKEGHPGHGPRYLWNATIGGKSYSKHLNSMFKFFDLYKMSLSRIIALGKSYL